jgi:hypothetical protein
MLDHLTQTLFGSFEQSTILAAVAAYAARTVVKDLGKIVAWAYKLAAERAAKTPNTIDDTLLQSFRENFLADLTGLLAQNAPVQTVTVNAVPTPVPAEDPK